MLAGPGGPVTCGPVRVIPGRLSVSRTFGDCQAKLEKYNGNPNVIVVDPEIHYINISEESHDYILLGCDGIFDRLSTDVAC
jgi:protein phosphatase 2C family protein 2/3